MMPDAALEATERQFFRLIGESNAIAQFYVHPFTLPELERGEKAAAHIEKYYESFDDDMLELGNFFSDSLNHIVKLIPVEKIEIAIIPSNIRAILC